MIKHITFKIFLAIFTICIVAMSSQYIASINLIKSNDINFSNLNYQNRLRIKEDVNKAIYDFGESSLKIVSDDIADTSAKYMRENPQTLEELSKDKDFQLLTQRKLFGRGYTTAVAPSEYFVVSHPSPIFAGQYLARMKDKEKFVHPTLFKFLDGFTNRNVGYGEYSFIDADGFERTKFATMSWVPASTKDDEKIAIMATSYKDDIEKFSSPIIRSMRFNSFEMNNILFQNELKIQVIFLINLIIVLIVISVFTYIMSFYLTKPLVKLSSVVKNIADGSFDYEVPNVNTNDEVSDLAKNIEIMRVKLKNKSIESEQRAAQLEMRASELEDALSIAKEKTLQMINSEKINNDKV